MSDERIFLNEISELIPDEDPAFYERMLTLYACLTENNKKFNLTAITDPHGVAVKHVADSYECFKAMRSALHSGASLIDVGAGAGFPSLVIAAASDFTVRAIDSTEKKCTYINETARKMGISNITASAGRAEEFGIGELRGKFDASCARAVARLNLLLELCIPLLKKDGLFFSMKGPSFDEEIAEAKNALNVMGAKIEDVISYSLPEGDASRKIIVIRKIRDTLPQYPRAYAKISKKPL